jgi:hypothetical protein
VLMQMLRHAMVPCWGCSQADYEARGGQVQGVICLPAAHVTMSPRLTCRTHPPPAGMIERYVKGRFSYHGDGFSPPEQEAFKDYMYHIIAGRGSGEFALRHLLAPGGGAWRAGGGGCLLGPLACHTTTTTQPQTPGSGLVRPQHAYGYRKLILPSLTGRQWPHYAVVCRRHT